jgi:transposase
MVDLVVEPHAGIPFLMTPLSGHSRAAQGVGAAVRLQVHPWHTTSGLTSLVADRALYREANREQLAPTPMQWSTRVPATVRDAPAAWAQADPPAMVALQAGERAHELTSTSGGVEPRWVRISAAPRQAQAQRTIATQWGKPRAQAVNALKP